MNQMAEKKGGYLFGDDYVDAAFDAPKQIDEAAIRQQAHIANGGEAEFKCPACKGNGGFYSYAGRYVGPCYKCKGKGNVSKGVAAAAKGKVTKERNKLAWAQANAEVIAYAHKRSQKGSQFYAGLLVSLDAYGNWTEKQVAIIQRDIAKDAEFWAAKKAEKVAAAAPVNMSAIEKMFAIASENKKNPKFYAGDMVIYPAKASGANPGAIYVKVKGEYAGKIASGRFFATNAAPAGLIEKIDELAADPRAAAAKWGREEVRCCFCGIELTDPVSRENGYGPICAGNWLGG